MNSKTLSMLIVIVLSALVMSQPAWARDYTYQGKVKGMVCAFCAYNVSKKVGALPSVDAQSVNVDLKAGLLDFKATAKIDRAVISSAFADSGFTLVELKAVPSSDLHPVSFSGEPLITFNFSSTDIEQVESVLDAIGNLAVSRTSLLSIKAPQSSEIALLKPILAGRKRVIKVQFIPVERKVVELNVFTATLNHK